MLHSVSPLKATAEMHFADSECVVPACLQPNTVSTVPVRHWRKENGVFSAPLKLGDIHSSHIQSLHPPVAQWWSYRFSAWETGVLIPV